jgi:16S rRNA processing protein RimM
MGGRCVTGAPEGTVGHTQLVPLGQVVNTHGTRGELRVRPFNPRSTLLRAGASVMLRRGDETQQRYVRSVRPHKHFLLLTLDGCDSMTAAQALIGSEVCVLEADLPPPGPDEIYHYQLIGMTVATTAGRELGTIVEVLTTPSNDVCVVRGGGREHLIPFIADVVKNVDRDHRRLIIDPLPGLLD